MTTKVISLPVVYFKDVKKQRALSPRMIASLTKACLKQHAGIPFGQKDIEGSFVSLVKRGLIERKPSTPGMDREFLWQVTDQAIEMLNAIGIKVAC